MRRVSTRRSAVFPMLVALALAVLPGCSPEPPEDAKSESGGATLPGAGAQRPWFVSRFGGPERKWQFGDGRRIVPQERPGMLIYEVTQFPGPRVTAEQQQAADELLAASERAAQAHGWYEYETGLASGYTLQFNDEAHYVNPAFLFDNAELDPDRPEFLMYYDTSVGKRLVGFMFYVKRAGGRGPQVGGPLTTWHFHVWSMARCFLGGLHGVGIPDANGRCARGKPRSSSPEMLHVWLVDHPKGRFATRMRIEPLLLERLIKERGF
jgi:hypothetical protein